MLAFIVASWWLRARGTLFRSTWFLRSCQVIAPLGFVAVLAGWTTTEVGRQPWTIYGLLRTSDSVTPFLSGTDVLLSLVSYGLVYLVMFPSGFTLMARIVRKGPMAPELQPQIIEGGASGGAAVAILSSGSRNKP